MHKNDLANNYQEHSFSGRKELSISIIISSILWCVDNFAHLETKEALSFLNYLLIPALLLYLIGFGKAIRSKGYQPAMFLLVFTGLVGLFILFILPHKNNLKQDKN